MSIVLSRFQIRPLLQSRPDDLVSTTLSPDLGLSTVEITMDRSGVYFPDNICLSWPDIEHIDKNPQACFQADASGITKIQIFSEAFNRLYSLMPTSGAPTMLISGIPMHRIKDTDPMADTREKIKAAAPTGRLLDTATGLGYTAGLAAHSTEHVTTIELDPAVLDIARQNPWSRPLFDSPNIEQRLGDSFDVVHDFDDAIFDRIIHDPPMFGLAGHLYSTEFYRQLFRLLKPRGRLFHYIGDPNSKSGRNTTAGVIRRLQEAGFKRVIRKPRAFGVITFR